MVRWLILISFMMLGSVCSGQEFKVEFDPNTDLTHYKTFKFGEGEIITPVDLRTIADSVMHRWIQSAIKDELTSKGLQQTSGAADLVVSYITGSQKRKDSQLNGPAGLTPGSNPERTFEHDYRFITFVVDLNDPKSNQLIWRVSTAINSNKPESQEYFDQIVMKGFRKFTTKPRKEKRKK